MKNTISRLITGICLIAMFGTVAYIGGLATNSVIAPSDVIAAEEETPCENNVCIPARRGTSKCVIPVGNAGSGCKIIGEDQCESYDCDDADDDSGDS